MVAGLFLDPYSRELNQSGFGQLKVSHGSPGSWLTVA